MKSYTDIEQSKKLAEFLPIESADCFWDYDEMQKFHRISWFENGYNKEIQLIFNENNICAWSLAALISIIPYGCLTIHVQKKYRVIYNPNLITEGDYDNPVDAAYEMIIKLHELNLL